ncbi:MAG TPA: DUF1461 domain-containing protein [Leucothrix sp.]|nr:DUF1461 domain-containing protein [Leucothrix sp.]
MTRVYWAVFLIMTFIITLPISWWLLSNANFAYGYLHDYAGIAEHIEQFAPANDYKNDFANTGKETRVELFAGIVKSIENQGVGLETLSYLDNEKRSVQLLIEAEITHLKDVAILLKKALFVAGVLALFWLAMVFWLRYKKISLPPAKHIVISTIFILLVLIGVLSLGPSMVFNQLHIWAFPDNHQWLFYYEESLMSTMMKAPDLFAYIGVMWFLVSSIITLIFWKILGRVLSSSV